MAIHGKGRGIKASDEFTVALCSNCHHTLDAGNNLTKEEKQQMWWNAFRNTWLELLDRNLVVTNLPIPRQEE